MGQPLQVCLCERQTDRQTDRQRARERETHVKLHKPTASYMKKRLRIYHTHCTVYVYTPSFNLQIGVFIFSSSPLHFLETQFFKTLITVLHLFVQLLQSYDHSPLPKTCAGFGRAYVQTRAPVIGSVGNVSSHHAWHISMPVLGLIPHAPCLVEKL